MGGRLGEEPSSKPTRGFCSDPRKLLYVMMFVSLENIHDDDDDQFDAF